jgi:FkbM family methyltransferase
MLMDPMRSRAARSLLWRVGRKIYQYARREGANHPATNGEYWLLDAAVKRSQQAPMTLLDVGSHLGDWSAQALRCLSRHDRVGEVHAFEPTPTAHQYLEGRFSGAPNIRLRQLALSDQIGTLPFYVVGELNGTNSLVDMQIGARTTVPGTTVDSYLKEHGIDHVALLKSDAEGHDLAVLRGGARALADGRIDLWQFEYNSRWIYARAFLRDVFELVRGAPYLVGKLYGNGVELFDAWHPELERYFEANFVLVRTGTPLESLGRPSRFDRSNVPARARRSPG